MLLATVGLALGLGLTEGRMGQPVEQSLAPVVPGPAANPGIVHIKRRAEPEHDFTVEMHAPKGKTRTVLAQAAARTGTAVGTKGFMDDFLSFKADVAEESDQTVIVTLDKTECNIGESFSVYYQRVPTDRHELESSDWVGLFSAQDPTVLRPLSVTSLGIAAQTGIVGPVECSRPGENFVRVVLSLIHI